MLATRVRRRSSRLMRARPAGAQPDAMGRWEVEHGLTLGSGRLGPFGQFRVLLAPRLQGKLGKVCTTVASGRSARRTERSDRENERSEFQRRLTFRLCRSYITISEARKRKRSFGAGSHRRSRCEAKRPKPTPRNAAMRSRRRLCRPSLSGNGLLGFLPGEESGGVLLQMELAARPGGRLSSRHDRQRRSALRPSGRARADFAGSAAS